MAFDNHRKDEEGEQGSSSGGQSSGIQFVDITVNNKPSRDDLLSAHEQNNIVSHHKDTHEGRVKKQKEKIDNYEALKRGDITIGQHRQNTVGSDIRFKSHPSLEKYNGADPKVSTATNEFRADTNEANQDQLKNELRPSPAFTPRPTVTPRPYR